MTLSAKRIENENRKIRITGKKKKTIEQNY